MNDHSKIIDFIKENMKMTEFHTDEDMRKYTTFNTGGRADLMVIPKDMAELEGLMQYLIKEKISYHILGHGSNTLVGDKGIREVVVLIEDNLKKMIVKGEEIEVEAGLLLADLAQEAKEHGLTGLEFVCGIPGTVGGAVVMNAGAYGGEIKDVLEEVQVLTAEGKRLVRKADELELAYRSSLIQKNGDMVLKAKFRLKSGDQMEIKKTMDELTRNRADKQPLDYPSAGSIFKRPEGHFTGKLIQDANLQGYSIGGAQVSMKHAGFIINTGQAATEDVLNLISHIQQVVKQRFQVELETEVKVIGELI
ncbi:UDP-N-acetylmuramate dehydrogenase [Dehalobacterium formicoaceticum]|uniref:UDP-N-acetylenolpyruvoylglucosamine reductase n=1 Tax=Dehalobacterium formicoaceticum TaxID=51515 RepID=A0ABT1Y3L9_9FIRM|nr:UDP-N-acetylmuramate dehydrogenase [Dehalobacterium formicoaceticum]MCR6544750.1 UDP-N-acetylmuramate dehydrogenase [Dehalobacterium formicoaceticum]